MSTATAIAPKTASFAKKEMRKQPLGAQPISWEKFQEEYLGREDEYKYEWVNGMVEKTKRTMNTTQLFIQRNLLSCFRDFLIAGKVHGELIAEGDILFLDKLHRRPDLAWFTNEQIDRLAEPNVIEVPLFLIEVISKHDTSEKLEQKMWEYRKAKVQVVWHIFPASKTVHVYSGENMLEMTVCEGPHICSAAPALPGFEVSVNDIFKKAVTTQ